MASKLLRQYIYDLTDIGPWHTVYALLRQISMVFETKILSTETSDFLKQPFLFSRHLIQCYMCSILIVIDRFLMYESESHVSVFKGNLQKHVHVLVI